MTGLVWFVHLVHYPMFATVAEAGDEHFKAYEREHLRRTAPLIPPIMLVELATAVLLLLIQDASVSRQLVWIASGLLAVVWASTFFGAVPMHTRLSKGFTPRAHRWLMRFNLLRTLAWSARSVVALMLLMK
jgi:uncharacterized membrane protein